MTISIFCLLVFIPIHSESITPLPNNVISGTFHDWEISLTFNDSVASGTIKNDNKIINLDNLKVIDKHHKFYIFDSQNNLKIYSRQLSDTKYLVLVKLPDVKLRFITNVDKSNIDEPRNILGQRNLFEAINELEPESKELSWKEQVLLDKQSKIQSSLDQRQKDIENMIKDDNRKDLEHLTKKNILEYYNNYKTDKIIENTNTQKETQTINPTSTISTNEKIKSFLSVPIHITWKKELRYSVLITDDTRQTYDTSYNSWIGNELKDVTITGKITNPSDEILQTFNGITAIDGQYTNKFLIPDQSTTRGKYTVSINAVKTFSDNTKSKSSTSETFFVIAPNTSFNNPPIANAGTDGHYTTGSSAKLDGSNSYDSDDSILYYIWSQTSGDTVTLSDNTIVNPTFTVPDIVESFDFSLIVNDGRKDSLEPDSVTITSLHSNAGANQTHINNTGSFIVNSTSVTLDGSQSRDALDHTITYLWTVLNGLVPDKSTITTANLTDNTIVKPEFKPDLLGNYTFQLKVNDGHELTDISNVTINVKNPTITIPP